MSYVDKLNLYLAVTPGACAMPVAPVARFAEWLDKEAAQEAMGNKPTPQVVSCPTPSSEGDEYVCRHPLCGRRWAKDEDKPPCPLV